MESIVLCGTLNCALWYISLCFVVHYIVRCGTLHCVLWYISLCLVVQCIVVCVHCIVGCGTLHCMLWYIYMWYVINKLNNNNNNNNNNMCYISLCFVVSLHCALWYIALCFVVDLHCIVLCGALHDGLVQKSYKVQIVEGIIMWHSQSIFHKCAVTFNKAHQYCDMATSPQGSLWMGEKSQVIPANTRHWANVDLMLTHRLRLRANNKSTLGQRPVFAETCYKKHVVTQARSSIKEG